MTDKPHKDTDKEKPQDDKEVRPAGPENMKDPPEHWSTLDEEGDESFPASDPPGNY